MSMKKLILPMFLTILLTFESNAKTNFLSNAWNKDSKTIVTIAIPSLFTAYAVMTIVNKYKQYSECTEDAATLGLPKEIFNSLTLQWRGHTNEKESFLNSKSSVHDHLKTRINIAAINKMTTSTLQEIVSNLQTTKINVAQQSKTITCVWSLSNLIKLLTVGIKTDNFFGLGGINLLEHLRKNLIALIEQEIAKR